MHTLLRSQAIAQDDDKEGSLLHKVPSGGVRAPKHPDI